jgi:hypothetical protein
MDSFCGSFKGVGEPVDNSNFESLVQEAWDILHNDGMICSHKLFS